MTPFSRRGFLRASAASAAACAAGDALGQAAKRLPSERVRLGIIGVAGRGAENLTAFADQEIVALCDVDSNHLDAAKAKHPAAKTHADFRRLVEQNNVDAVVISTPDHVHAFAATAAMRAGKDVFCESPLAHSVYECRVLASIAKSTGRVTQCALQTRFSDHCRRAVEIVRAGHIGLVRAVFVWNNRRPLAGKNGDPTAKAPANLDYNLWLGPSALRPYHESHLHGKWRWWWDYGGGVLADAGCELLDLPYSALALKPPASASALGKKEYEGDNDVPSSLQVDYEFHARDGLPAVRLSWLHGGKPPKPIADAPQTYAIPGKDGKSEAPAEGVLFVGSAGELLVGPTSYKMLPEDKFAAFKAPDVAAVRADERHKEWIEAVKNRGKTTAGFASVGPVTEAVLLGNCAYRAREYINWDSVKMQSVNSSRASYYVQRTYRPGWNLF